MKYEEFLTTKLKGRAESAGLPYQFEVSQLFPFQRDMVQWALRKGRCAIFADTGLGKTLTFLTWAKNIPGPVLILSPLSVAHQTVREAEKFGIEDVGYAKTSEEVKTRIVVTNYERIDNFNFSEFEGIVCDEASILKGLGGKTKDKLIDRASVIPYRLACTATPAPNDFMELGNQAEFLGIKTHKEMLAEFFIHDGGEISKWRLKGHAKEKFWQWLASWAIVIRLPSDLGYEDGDYILKPFQITEHIVESDYETESLIPTSMSLSDRQRARRASVDSRVNKCAEIISESKGQWLVWCDRNVESEGIVNAVPKCEEVTGSMSPDEKEEKLDAFSLGKLKRMVSKPKIASLGMNFQTCHNMIFCGLSDSYEQFYRAVRRCWRFGQKKTVNVHIVLSSAETIVLENIQRKERDMRTMQDEMVKYVSQINQQDIKGVDISRAEYEEKKVETEDYTMHLGDCVDALQKIPSESVHYSIFSPPFASLYTFSDSERDMSNVLKHEDFFEHFSFAVEELFRVLKPGRLLSFHCMNTLTSKAHDGYIGIRDFRGELIRLFQKHGFIYHSEVCIWKDPVTAMQRTKAIGLLWKQVRKDSTVSRQGIADYLVTMQKPGLNPEPVTHTAEEYPVALWRKVASPVWFDINPSDTLQYMRGRESTDERHICPLQLEVIRRGLNLWTNPGDVVLSPFAGIGSEGYCALETGRKFIGVELKKSYFDRAVENLNAALDARRQESLFGEREAITSDLLLHDSML